MATDNRIHFWRRNPKVPGSLQPVYGAQHPPLDPRRHRPLKDAPKASSVCTKSKKPSTFHEFARSTNDAWDIDDEEDDGMFSLKQLSSSPVQSRSMPQTPCLKIIKTPEDTEPLPPTLDRQEPISTNPNQDQLDIESGPANGRVVKSSSDAQLNVNAARNTLQKQQSLPVRPVIPLVARISDQNASGAPPMTVREKTRLDKFKQLLASPNTDLEELRKHSWSGIPREVRPVTWRLLSGYLPANRERRDLVLQRKREEYFGFIEQYYHSRTDENHRDTYRQRYCLVFQVFERILFIWAIRHPASGYVQGINDLVTPFFVVFLSEFVEEDVENFEMASLPLDTQRNIEADSFWCMSKLLDGIQDNYTFAQPGIQIKVKALEELVSRIDEDVHVHFQKYEVEYLQFAFRWMNNLLMRELPLRCTIRLWDTYQAESEGFSHFHLYVCSAFLIKWRKEILSMVDFQSLLMLLQNLPTIHWGNEEVGLLLAEAYRLKYMFADAPSHYKR
ncbi:TBC1 domain family member 22B-like [Sinocyclocheilus rhinocerous]|uniref:TBC1 domain family member 22B-like n=1 Tax=Sinocyclocheilus rhinocerous TaxID=307959 RepID=UPI0007B912F8|nr:PREDICTED: TBC1 domain family member 22B-like [Sinocyclocheilus rhinocerous]